MRQNRRLFLAMRFILLLIACAATFNAFRVSNAPVNSIQERQTEWSPDILSAELQKMYWLLPSSERQKIASINQGLLENGFSSFASERDFFQLDLEVQDSGFYMDSVRVAAKDGMFDWVDDTAELFQLNSNQAVDFSFRFWSCYDTALQTRSHGSTPDTRGFEKARDDWHRDVKRMLR
jgi:hypothetical protein